MSNAVEVFQDYLMYQHFFTIAVGCVSEWVHRFWFFIHQLIDKWNCLLEVTINKPALKSPLPVFVGIYPFISLGRTYRSRISGSSNKFRFNILEIVMYFPKQDAIPHSHQQVMSDPVFLHLQHLLWLLFSTQSF